MKYKEPIIAMLLLAGAVSCEIVERPSKPEVPDLPISLSIGQPDTKAVIDTTVMPPSYTIYLSAYHYAEDATSVAENYFSGVRFNQSESDTLWHAAPVRYWPLGGTLDFLGIASDYDLSSSLQWGTDRNTEGVVVRIPEDFEGSSEILYSYAPQQKSEVNIVPMVFHHTQAMLEFNFKSECEDILRLVDITVKDCYCGGTLIVINSPVSYAKWDVENSESRDVKLSTVFPETPLDKGHDKSYSIAILPKTGQSFTVRFRQRANITCPWETMSVEIPFDYEEPAQKWKAGKKYIYNFLLDPDQIRFTAEATNMDTGDGTLVYVNEDTN